jgi:hypothetical protein
MWNNKSLSLISCNAFYAQGSREMSFRPGEQLTFIHKKNANM